ncbi:hypothetical protein K7X08_021657 [Anisodus acutangulus]|uniref:Phosphofructokinase domain-containing protein n=1 Tax=Anisodus acutangulus TaxID=402998 RepID=A0A9Q1M4M6_9SOLA|nr:hypothetical protein K7X08_021657 [Anisodus acutangulus]
MSYRPGLIKVILGDRLNLPNEVVGSLTRRHDKTLKLLNLDEWRVVADASLMAVADNFPLLNDLVVSKCALTYYSLAALSYAVQVSLQVFFLPDCSTVSNKNVASFAFIFVATKELCQQGYLETGFMIELRVPQSSPYILEEFKADLFDYFIVIDASKSEGSVYELKKEPDKEELVKTSPSIADAALGRIVQGTKVLSEGGYDKIFRQTFEADLEEQLQNSFACYLSISAGPVMEVLYLSTAKLAFCSDNPLSYKTEDKTEWSYYKERGINMLFVLGGNGTHAGANAIHDERRRRRMQVAVVGVPTTIDNDIMLMDRTFGLILLLKKHKGPLILLILSYYFTVFYKFCILLLPSFL